MEVLAEYTLGRHFCRIGDFIQVYGSIHLACSAVVWLYLHNDVEQRDYQILLEKLAVWVHGHGAD